MKCYPIPAVGVVILRNDFVLLIKKARGIFEGQWCIPGGKIEYGENIFDTIKREIHEETSLLVDTAEFITFQETIEKKANGEISKHFVFLNFVVRDFSGELRANDDAREARFFHLKELHSLNISTPTIETFKLMKLMG